MAASLIKLFITATASAPTATGTEVETTVNPAVTRFNATITGGMIAGGNTTIPAASFLDDDGGTVTDLPDQPTDGYINVYVNGVLQEGGLSTLSTTQLVISTVDIEVGTPVVLQVSDYSNTDSTVTVQPIISAPDITIVV